MRARRVLVWAVMSIGLLATAAVKSEAASAYAPHHTIWIDGNWSFTPANGVTRGSGTSEDPFVIEGWLFEGEEAGIGVSNTTAHFVIRSCRFAGISRWAAISFSQVRNGRVEECIVEGTLAGHCVGLFESSNCAIVGCDLINRTELAVVGLWGCTGVTVTDNVIRSAPRWASWCGIVLWGSAANLIGRNVISDCGTAIALNRDEEGGTDSIGNRVFANTMSSNEGADISVQATSTGNVFWHNNLTTVSLAVREANAWDEDREGNYWGRTGSDPDGDGISNRPYPIQLGDVDSYPLMRPWRAGASILGIKSVGSDELVTIRNWGQDEITLRGWRLLCLDGDTGELLDSLPFPVATLPPNGTLVVHSGPESVGKTSGGLGTAEGALWTGWLRTSRGAEVWNDDGGIAQLVDASGRVVDELKYGH